MEKFNPNNFEKRDELEFSEEKESEALKEYKEAMMESSLEGMPKLDIMCGKEGGLLDVKI